MVAWGLGRGGLWVHTSAAVTESFTNGFARLGRTLAEVPHETLLARATRVAEHAPDDPTPETTTEEAADWFSPGYSRNCDGRRSRRRSARHTATTGGG